MAEAKKGDKVSVHYTGKLEDDTVFDSSTGGDPLSFEIGSGQIIPGFEKGVIGMAPGDSKTVDIAPEQAYGPYRDDQIIEVSAEKLPDDIDPEVGQRLQVQQQNGETAVVTVKEVTDEVVKLDANHPLAGKKLTFDIELVSVD
ncbi:MAG: peptidylprolyl isomerase [Rhodothermales bacterium]